MAATDTEQIRVGVEYVIIGDRARWPIRAGYFNDRQTSPARRHHQTVGWRSWPPGSTASPSGAGIGVGPMLIDVAYLRESGDYVDPSLFPQSVTTQRFLVSIIYRHLVRQ